MDPENKNLGQNVESMGVGLPPELPSHEQNREKLAETLHKDEPLPHLRTYHGDIAEFIKSKDQSLTDIALKQHEKNEKEKIEERKAEKLSGKEKKSSYQISTSFIIYIISAVLILGSVATGSYLLLIRENQNPVNISKEKTILPAKKTVVLDSSSANWDGLKKNFESLKSSPDYKDGITAIIISDSDKKTSITSLELSKKLQFNIPSSFLRSLDNEFMLGLYDDNVSPSFFLIFKVKDYGIAFQDMLKWENVILNDFKPLLKENATTSTAHIFKDLIVKNKDTRAAVLNSGYILLIYAFLDKGTVLITESEAAIKGLLDTYVAGNTVR